MKPAGKGPLSGLRVIELAGIGPAPFGAMILADMGADVIRVERVGYRYELGHELDFLYRGRRSIALNLKHPKGVATLMRLIEDADVLLEGFRPGVTERLHIGPQECFERNPRLIYGRVTGWGREGSYAMTPGHDINYIAMAGALHQFGYPDSLPTPPMNVVGDMGGGGMLLAVGVLAALWEARSSGKGQVVDAAMLDGAALMLISMFSMMAAGQWDEARGANVTQGAAPFYGVYETSDGKFVSIAAAEESFYAALCEKLGLDAADWGDRYDPSNWAERRAALASLFRSRTRAEWCELLEGSEACFAPVLAPSEVAEHPHNKVRETFIEVDGVMQPAPAPRFSRTASGIPGGPPAPGANTAEVLRELGVDDMRIAELRELGVVNAS